MNFSNPSQSQSIFMSMTRPPLFDPLRFARPTPPAKRREALIAELAYFRALTRGFAPGHEVEDWLAAEAEIELRHSGAFEI